MPWSYCKLVACTLKSRRHPCTVGMEREMATCKRYDLVCPLLIVHPLNHIDLSVSVAKADIETNSGPVPMQCLFQCRPKKKSISRNYRIHFTHSATQPIRQQRSHIPSNVNTTYHGNEKLIGIIMRE